MRHYEYINMKILNTIKAVHLRKKTFVRKEDIDKYFKDAPSYKKRSYKKVDDKEYYRLREIMLVISLFNKFLFGIKFSRN